MIRFLADENVSRVVIERLRRDGHDVISIADTKPAAPDIIRIADADGRILITEDPDFGELIIRQRFALNGAILLELNRVSNTAEADIVAAHSHKLSGNLVVIEPGRIRFRPLPD